MKIDGAVFSLFMTQLGTVVLLCVCYETMKKVTSIFKRQLPISADKINMTPIKWLQPLRMARYLVVHE